MKPYRHLNKPWELFGYSGADYIRDNNTQKGVTRYTDIINGLVIYWHSQSEKIVTL